MTIISAIVQESHWARCPGLSKKAIVIHDCIHTLIDKQVYTQPYGAAIDAHDGSFSFAELATASSRLSEHLIRLGVCRQARVAILMEKSAFYPVSVLAVLKSEGVFVPLDPSHPQKRLQHLVREIDPVVIISSTASLNKARSLHEKVLVVDQAHVDWVITCPSTAKTTTTIPAVSTCSQSDAAYIIFTSGSTGNPKGVVIEHGAFLTSALARGSRTGLGCGSRVLQYAAHTFDVSVDEILTTLIHGGCVCIPSEMDRFQLAQTINRLGVNHALLTPTSAKMLEPADVPGLDTMQLGGELLSDEVIRKWDGRVRLFNVYGPAEASVACIMMERTREDLPGMVIGQAIGGICRVVDADDHHRLLPPGAVGELVLGGRILAREYLNDAARTASSFVRAPLWAEKLTGKGVTRFYKTGDMAEMDEDGLVTLHGRKDNQIKVRGQRINVEEIEAVLLSTNLIQSVVVEQPKKGKLANKLTAIVGIGDATSAAYVSPFSNDCRAKALEEHLQSRLHHELSDTLTSAMVPSTWIQLPYLPQNSSGKIDRKCVREWVAGIDAAALRLMLEAPDSKPVEMSKANGADGKYKGILCQVLGVAATQLRMDLSFIRNGGDSIAAMELCRRGKEAAMSFWIGDILSPCNLRELLELSATRLEKLLPKGKDQPGVPFPLSPVQQFFFHVIGDGPDMFTQSVDLELKERISVTRLKQIMDSLVSAHPMLRARFHRHSGTWVQVVSSETQGSYAISYDQLPGTMVRPPPPPSLSIQSGTVFQVGLWRRGTSPQLLQLSAHHLVIDLVSWRVILDDLAKLLRREALSGSNMTFQTWCSLQREYAKELDPETVLPIPVAPDQSAYWYPPGGNPPSNTHKASSRSSFVLGQSSARRLMSYPARDSDSDLNVRPVDTMIGSFYKAFRDVFPDRETPTVFVESHGREPWHPTIDVSETVGWFTTAYPIHVPAHFAGDLESAIAYSTQRRRSVPANGHPYWCHRFLGRTGTGTGPAESSPMEFVFNFAGQFQQFERDGSPFRTLSTVGEETAHPDTLRLSLFDMFVSMESDQQLRFTLTYPSGAAHRDRIELLTQTWKSVLDSATDATKWRSLQPPPPSAWLDCPEDVSASLRERGISVPDHVQHVYWASSLQGHMLRSQARNPIFYRVVGRWQLTSSTLGTKMDTQRLRDAWRLVVSKHPSLRTIFIHSETRNEYLGVVMKESLPEDKISQKNGKAQEHRLVIHESSDNSICFSLEFSHAIMDATSRSILLEGLIDAYTGRPVAPDNSSYQTYLQDRVVANTNNSREDTRCIFPPDLPWTDADHDASTVPSLPVPPGIYTTEIAQACSRQEVTMPSLIFTAWSLLLSKFVGSADVSFAYVVSQRFSVNSNSERCVGLYVDLQTFRINIGAPESNNSSLWNFAREVQQRAASSMHTHNQGFSASKDAGNGRSSGRVNTMVNVRNAGVDSLELRRHGLELSMQCFQDPWDVSSSGVRYLSVINDMLTRLVAIVRRGARG